MTQCEMILRYMEECGSITPLDALREFGCMRLASRICDLKRDGVKIHKERETQVNRYGKNVSFARYRLGGAE